MLNKNIVVIVGNGLNRLVAEVAKNQPRPKNLGFSEPIYPAKVSENIHSLCNLWDQFNFLEDIQKAHPNLTTEEIFGLFKQFAFLLKNHEFCKDLLKDNDFDLDDIIEKLIENNIVAVSHKFMEYERIGWYREIRKLFTNFGFDFRRSLKVNDVSHLFICTTNYDGILDTLLHNDKFLPDGFANYHPTKQSFRQLNKWVLNKEKYSLVHIHGTYKLVKEAHDTYKIVGTTPNENPVIILNQPNSKEVRIKEDPVLNVYFEKLIQELKTCHKLIILGNSFQNEPHLKKAIKENFNRMNTELVICDLNPDAVERQLAGYYVGPTLKITTDGLNSERELIHLFDELFGDDLMSYSRNIINYPKAA